MSSATQINLAWTASTDNVGVTGYRVERCQGAGCSTFSQIATPATSPFTDAGLTGSTSYSYRVRAADSAGNLSSFSGTSTATTSGSPDTTPPNAPTNLVATAASPAQINLSWTASTDNVGVTGYRVERCQSAGCSNFAQIATPASTTFNDSGLTASTSYSYRVRATDAANNNGAFSATASASTITAPDTQPPTAPTNLTATASSTTQINLSWTGSTDNVGVTGYKVERCSGAGCSNFAQIATPASTPFNDTGLTAATSYSYRVRAADAASNLSSYSSTTTASTMAAADTTPPTAPTNLTATAASSSQINLAWTASTDNVGVTGYKVERCQGASCSNFAQIATPATTTFNDTGLTASTSYSYRVRATDAANNLSNYSATATALTLASADTTPPTAPSNLTATASSATQINLSWTASTDNIGVTGYRVERCQGAGCSNFSQIATPASTTFSDTGLTTSTSYSYRVRATDTAANLSAFSSTATTSTLAGTTVTVSITPKRGGLTVSQSLNFTATVTNDVGGAGVTWTASAGSFSTQALLTANFVAPSAAGVITVTATSVADVTNSASATIGVTDLPGVTTYHNNLSRDGSNIQEYALSTSNVATASFAKLFSCTVDAAIYAQPLWMANVVIGGGTHNVIFAVTSRNSVYAFDADASPCTKYWNKSLLPTGETWVPSGDVSTGDLEPEVGIVGTPVIDVPSRTMYVVSKSKNNGSSCVPSSACHQRLHALSLIDGTEKFGGPIDITSSISVPGTGDGSSGGNVPFDTLRENQRPGLALVNGVVYVSWASHGDNNPYHGWVIGYDKLTLSMLTVYNDSPNADRAGIWMGGGAPAADSSNNLYMITGNGAFDGDSSTAPNNDFGDSILKLGTSGGLSLSSWFTPSNESTLNGGDTDLGSGGATVLVDAPTSPKPRLLIGGGKEGKLYLLDRDALGNFGDANAWQIFSIGNGIFATPAFWQNQIYIAGVGGRLKTFQFSNTTGKFNTSQTSQSATSFGFPGSTPSVSASGTSNGIVWALNNNQYCTQQSSACGPAVLHAYDATNLATELWNSSQVAADKAGNAVKFTVPTVANGKVYVGTRGSDSTNGGIGELDVYGLKPD